MLEEAVQVQEADPHAGQIVKQWGTASPTTHQTKPAQKHLSMNSAIFLLNISVPAERSRSWVAELDWDV